MTYTTKQLAAADASLFRDLIQLFGEAFDDPGTYQRSPPNDTYIRDFLTDHSHLVLAALNDGVVVGGLVAYELRKFEQERSEIYIYDLAVSESHRRNGVATMLIEKLQSIASTRGAHVIFVQADNDDIGATRFYRTLSARELATRSFDIPV